MKKVAPSDNVIECGKFFKSDVQLCRGLATFRAISQDHTFRISAPLQKTLVINLVLFETYGMLRYSIHSADLMKSTSLMHQMMKGG
jgi:hypothetical protein